MEDRLRALYDLQLIHSRIDKIRSVRGELPLEVEDLEDEVAGLELEFQNLKKNQNNLAMILKLKKLLQNKLRQ